MEHTVPEVNHETVASMLADRLKVETLRSTQLEALAEQLLKERNAALDRVDSLLAATNDTKDE